jgi:hypothetical protein
MDYKTRLENECKLIETETPSIKKAIDRILEIYKMDNRDFDYNIERKHLMYKEMKKILNL